jgi:hypothetical protein
MGVALQLAKWVARFLITLVVFDVIGVVFSFLLIDVWSSGGDGPPALAYVIWGVIGLLCGGVGFHVTGATFSGPGAFRRGLAVCGVASACLGLVTAVLYFVSWRAQSFADPYVPDSAALTVTFFGAILAGMGFMTYALKS